LARAPHPDQPKLQALHRYKHQEQAIALAQRGESYVVTTGTGSGKSLCFFIPIVTRVLAEKRSRRQRSRTRAIIIYPMNALANSQLEELDKFVGNVPGQASGDLRSLHRARGRRGAPAHRRQPARHPPDQLHDARAADDPAGRAGSAGHGELHRPAFPGARRAAHLPRSPGSRCRPARASRA
jgi:hypothetical protein